MCGYVLIDSISAETGDVSVYVPTELMPGVSWVASEKRDNLDMDIRIT